MSMVEKVARAMVCNSTGTRDPDKMTPAPRGQAGLVPLWRCYEHLARAAIEAMREPSEAMVFAGLDSPRAFEISETETLFRPGECWRAMIASALAEERL